MQNAAALLFFQLRAKDHPCGSHRRQHPKCGGKSGGVADRAHQDRREHPADAAARAHNACRARAAEYDRNVFPLFADKFKRVDSRRNANDSRSVLIVVKNGYIDFGIFS